MWIHRDMGLTDKSFKFTKQRDSMECGVACLRMVADYWGIRTSLSMLQTVCLPTAEGISLKGIVDGASEIGLSGHAMKISCHYLSESNIPVILHWNQNHFVVLYRVSKNGKCFHIADPAKGKYKLSLVEFGSHWFIHDDNKGIALFLEPNSTYHKTDNTAKDERSFGFLLNYIKKYKKHFLIIFLGLLVGCLLQLIMPFLTQAIVDLGIRHKDISLIWIILLGELMIIVGRTSTDFIRRWLMMHISMRINISLVSDFFIKLLKLPMAFFDTKMIGDLLQRIGDHSRVQNFLTGKILGTIFSTLSFIIFGVVLYVYDVQIFMIFLIGSVIYGIWIVSFLHRRKVIDYEMFEQNALNQNKTYQFITSIQEIKLQNCERRRRWEWEDIQADLFLLQMKYLKLQQTQEAGSIFINEAKNIVITVAAATAVIHGDMTLGAMLAVQYIIGQLNSPVEQLMSFIYSLQDVKISLERINEIHTAGNEETRESKLIQFKDVKSISLQNVFFKYDWHALKDTISDVSFEIPNGKVTAIVGASGSGKTTLIKLILGFYRVRSGSISIAGTNIEEYNLKWWRNHCGVVMQDGKIFSESIARNIAVDDGPIDDSRLLNAAKIANIHNYIMTLPLKYNTKIGQDGNGLSQGQKQRILIARAVYKNPEFIFLDEATNALDAKNELEIVRNLNEFYKGRTVVVVAHRLSTVCDADHIIVLDRGKLVESGTHSNLIGKRGAYYNLVRNQLELGS